ncbi:hypothetical protein A6R68_21965, partial [Neotoma lepida]
DFLPRGSGIVTRRPLVLQLVTSKAVSHEVKDVGMPEEAMHVRLSLGLFLVLLLMTQDSLQGVENESFGKKIPYPNLKQKVAFKDIGIQVPGFISSILKAFLRASDKCIHTQK